MKEWTPEHPPKPQWVQSKYSKDAKKWKVHERYQENEWYWRVDAPAECPTVMDLPKDEYIPCDPPERWETCTRDEVNIYCCDGCVLEHPRVGRSICTDSGYRWAWSEKDPDAVVIQRKVTE